MNDHELDERVRALPRDIAPPVDLWPDLAASIAARPRRRTPWVPWAAAAAVVIGAATWMSTRPEPRSPVTIASPETPTPSPLVAEPVETAAPTPTPTPAPKFTALFPEEPHLRDASLALASAYAARRSGLDRHLLATFDDSLGLVDDAIDRSRAALIGSPDDPGLQRALDRAYRHKLSLLRRATEVETKP